MKQVESINNKPIQVLAYADDVAIIAGTRRPGKTFLTIEHAAREI